MIRKIKNYLGSLQRSTSAGKFIPFVDGLRFLAIVPVVIQHASERLLKYNEQVQVTASEAQAHFLVSRGAIGVIIFFTLSGFILSLPFASGNSSFSYKKYLGRRLTRLEPPFLFWMSLFAGVLMIQSQLPISELLEHWLASVFYVHTVVYQEFSIINPVAWSLEVEIQYYLIAPFLAILYFSQPDKRFRRSALVVTILIFIAYQHSLGWHLFPIKASILGHLQHFLIGMLIADLYKNDTAWVAKKSLIWDILAPLSLLIMAYTWTEEFGKTLIMNTALTVLFLAAIKGKYFPKVLSFRWVTVIGGMCYTIYLIHLPLLEMLYSFIGSFGQSTFWSAQLSISLLIALPLVLLSSMIGYKTIEQPFMKRKPKLLVKAASGLKTSGTTLNKSIMKRIISICLLCISLSAAAQEPAENMAMDKVRPLGELIDLAVAYAPAIDALSTSQDLQREEMTITKKKWMRHLSLAAGVNYGNGIMADQLTGGIGTESRVTYLNRQNVTYNVGLNIRLPFTEVSSRKHEIKIKKLEIERLEYLKQDQQKLVKEEVIRRYKSLMICLKSVELKTEVVETNNMALKVAENYFKAAKMPIEEYRTMLDKTFTARLELEKAKNEAWYCLQSLNAIVGQSILK